MTQFKIAVEILLQLGHATRAVTVDDPDPSDDFPEKGCCHSNEIKRSSDNELREFGVVVASFLRMLCITMKQ